MIKMFDRAVRLLARWQAPQESAELIAARATLANALAVRGLDGEKTGYAPAKTLTYSLDGINWVDHSLSNGAETPSAWGGESPVLRSPEFLDRVFGVEAEPQPPKQQTQQAPKPPTEMTDRVLTKRLRGLRNAQERYGSEFTYGDRLAALLAEADRRGLDGEQ